MTKEECEEALNLIAVFRPLNTIENKYDYSKKVLQQLINEHFEETEIEETHEEDCLNEVGELCIDYICKKCGSSLYDLNNINYCPYCGRKIVKGGKND